ncbi:MAG: thiolase family protein [Alphaproteobacteria bacterium]|nr:thiolase family protein [Alphaproteobacteria bacterium]
MGAGSSTVGITGCGHSIYLKKSDRTLFSFLAEAARDALASAGLTRDDIDGLAVCSFELPPDNAVTLGEQFGLSLSWAYLGTAGGAGPVASVANSIRAVESGQAKAVLCIAGDNYDVSGHYRLMDRFNKALINYGVPHGFGGANGLFAMIQRKHMETYGTTRAQLGRLAVDMRANARANPAALLHGAMSLDDYLDARVIADPLRLFDCVLPCQGAEAVVVTTLDRAPPGKGVRALAARERHNHPVGELTPLRGGWELFRDALYADAGMGPADMQFVQAYDDYPIMVAIQLEDLGFCPKGEVGRLFDANSFTWQGSLPVNTGGGQLSCGQSGAGGGMIGLVEAVRQLRHEGGERQIANVSRGLVSGYGMVGYGHGLSTSAIILERLP